MKQVWKMTKAELVDEIEQLMAAKGQARVYPLRADVLRWSKTELENECAELREEATR